MMLSLITLMKVISFTMMVCCRALIYYTGIIGQEIYNPPDVSGWQRDQDLDKYSNPLWSSWQIMELFNGYLFDLELQAQFIDLAIELSK